MLIVIAFMTGLLSLSGCTSGSNAGGRASESAASARAATIHIPVRSNGVVGTLVVPDTTRAHPGVLRIGGGEGGISVGDAETIASEGYAVLAIAYFGMEELPADLEEVPLEYFGKAIAWMKASPNIDGSRLAVVGISRGSTVALLLPTLYIDFDAVVAIAPSHVTWQSHYLDWDRYAEKSSHTWRGKPIPFVPYDFSSEAALEGCNDETAACVKMYEYSLQQHDRVRDALIPVEQIRAPILLLSGEADSMWPSSKMAALIMQRLNQHSFPYEHRSIAFENAGHCGINSCYDHAPLAGDRAAVEGMRQHLFQFLDRNLLPQQ
jgi:dienelactone hydrolase